MAYPVYWSRLLLATIVAVEAALIGASMWVLSSSDYPFQMALERRPLVSDSRTVVVRRDDIVDTLSIFYGSGAFGRDPLAEEGRPHSYRGNLSYDSGHCTWVVLDDRATPSDGLWTLGEQNVKKGSEAEAVFEESVSDGILNFFYDLGANQSLFLHNWDKVARREEQMSPLLGWMKKIDFLVLASYDPRHCGALEQALTNYPEALILGPPLPSHPSPALESQPQLYQEAVKDLQLARSARRLRTLSPGWHPLTSRLSAFVYATDRHAYALALVIRTGTRHTLLAGAEGRTLVTLIEEVETAGGIHVTGFVGATGFLMASQDEDANRQARRLFATHPELRIAAGYETSTAGLDLLRAVFGPEHVNAAQLGTRIPLSTF